MSDDYEFAPVQIERAELTLLLRLLERAERAGWVGPEDEEDFTALLGTIREEVLDFDLKQPGRTLPAAQEGTAVEDDE